MSTVNTPFLFDSYILGNFDFKILKILLEQIFSFLAVVFGRKFGPKYFCFGIFGLNHLPKLDLFSDFIALCPIINLFIMEIKKSFKRS